MAKQVVDIVKDVKKRKDLLAKHKKEFSGDGKIDVLNEMSTLDDRCGKLDGIATSIREAKTKYQKNEENIGKAKKQIEALTAAVEKMTKEQDTYRKILREGSKSYNDALNMVKKTANTIKDVISRNKLVDKTKDTKDGDFAAIMSEVKDITDVRAIPI